MSDLIAAVVPNITITKKPLNFIWVTFVALMVLAMLSQAESAVTPTVPASMISPSLFMAVAGPTPRVGGWFSPITSGAPTLEPTDL